MFRVYQAINIVNGKKYIGKESGKTFSRMKGHLSKAFKENSKTVFHQALRKHGKEAFVWSILEECNSDQHALEREMDLIKENNTLLPHGYNQLAGGRGSKIWTHEMIMAEAIKYTYIRQWFLADCKSYVQAYMSPRFNEYKAHMINMKERLCTKNELTEIAKNCTSRDDFFHKFKKEYSDAIKLGLITELFPNSKNRVSKPYGRILCHQTGTIYSGVKETSEALNLTKKHITRVLRKEIRYSKYTFEEVT